MSESPDSLSTPDGSLVSPIPPALAPWADAIREAGTSGRHLNISGGGTKAFLRAPLPPDALSLGTTDYSGIVAYEPTELVITVKAGTSLASVEAALAERGQSLAFEPPHFSAGSTVGGMVAAGLSGPARASVGALRDYVLGVHLLNGRGQYMEFGGQVMKNVAGYDVSRLLTGSMGALGVITQVSLKVLPVAPAEATLRFALTQAEAITRLARWRGQPLPLNASCWAQDPQDAATGHLTLRLRGAVAAVESASEMLTRTAGGERLDASAMAADWTACRDHQLPFFQSPPDDTWALWRLSVAPTTPPLTGDWPTLMEWHGGLRWVWASLAATPTLRAWAQAGGGHATVFRWPGTPTSQDIGVERVTPLSGPLLAIHQRLKDAFDPAGIFPPGLWRPAH